MQLLLVIFDICQSIGKLSIKPSERKFSGQKNLRHGQRKSILDFRQPVRRENAVPKLPDYHWLLKKCFILLNCVPDFELGEVE